MSRKGQLQRLKRDLKKRVSFFESLFCWANQILSKALCYLPILPELHAAGAKVFRIEGLDYETSELRAFVKLYKKALLQMVARDEFEHRRMGLARQS